MVDFSKIAKMCDCCGNKSATESIQIQEIEYGRTVINVAVPVISCKICNIDYTDERAEEIRTNAIVANLDKIIDDSLKEFIRTSSSNFNGV